MQINLTGFLRAKQAREFMGDLWRHLVSAQSQAHGFSQHLIEEEKKKAAVAQVGFSLRLDDSGLPSSSFS